MLLRTRCHVVLGLLVCLGTLLDAQVPATGPVLFDRGPFADANGSGCSLADRPGDSVAVVGLTDAVDPVNAPIPSNDSERLLFRQVYDTLVRVDCDFIVRPGLAAEWRLDITGTTWTLTLRPDARFSDGTPVTARDVIASWTRNTPTLLPEVSRDVQTATALDDRTLVVVFQQHLRPGPNTPSTPGRLAHPAFAVSRPAADSPWPLGTRDVRVESASASDSRTTLMLVPTSGAPAPRAPSEASVATPAEAGVLRFLVIRTRDVRDILEQGVDLLVTRDPGALAYASALAQFDSISLPWSRSYVFVSRESGPSVLLTPPLRQQLADDAVPGEARGASYEWAQVWERCAMNIPLATPPEQPPPPGTGRSGRIVYDQADAVARALAERIVALTAARSADSAQILDALVPEARSRKLRMAALPGPVFPSALLRGDDAGYVVALDRSNGCGELTMLREQAPWITGTNPVPLVETRPRALLRKGRSHVTVEGDGGLLIGPAPGR